MAIIKSILFVGLFVFLVILKAVGQQTSGTLEIKRLDNVDLPQIIKQLDVAKSDTNKVNLLVKQSHLYWLEKTIQNKFLDSSYIVALAAQNLSAKLHFVNGSNEANFMLARIAVEKENVPAAMLIANHAYGEQRARLLLIIGEHLVFSRELRSQIDKASPILDDAIKTSKGAGSSNWYYQSLLLLGKYYFLKGDISKGKNAILQIIKSCDQASDYANEAHYWSELAHYIPETERTAGEIIKSDGMAVKFYLKAGNKADAAYALRDKAWDYLAQNQLDSAENTGLKAFSMLFSLKMNPSFATYLMMTDIYQQKGNFPQALKYILASLNLPKLNDHDKWNANRELAVIYDQLNQPKKAFQYAKAAFDYAFLTNDSEVIFWKYRQVEDQIKIGDAKNALNEFITAKLKPVDANQKQFIAAIYGDLYFALNDYTNAERYYLKMIELDKEVAMENSKTLGFENKLMGSEALHKIGWFYIERKNYARARPYLVKALTGFNSSSVEEQSNIEFSLFKADSALGNYLSAIRHFERSKNVKDSIFNATKSRQFSELEIQYQTGQREKSFLALKNKSILQNQELERGRLEKNITLAGIGMLFIVSGLVYNGYRNKNKSNIALETKQREINLQNSTLQTLLTEKDSLLTEKDWLLREVHHRVKNNLQIVMSLLSSQSAFLENTAALDAIHESQNRVQAISLIHQKLYSGTNLASITMAAYVSDLIGYLADCFDTRHRGIRIEQMVENFNLDLAQAVPLGLILNEAITNAIKYAFDEKGGEIIIAIQEVGTDGLMLHISDNGKGLPADFDIKSVSSLGMEMMKALSKQLGGELKIRNKSGLHISLEFLIEHVYRGRPGLQT